MGMLSVRGRILAASSYLVALGVFYACTPAADENPAVPHTYGADSGPDSSGSVGPTNPGPESTTAPICGKYGGFDGVKTVASAIIDAAKADCRIGQIVSDAVGDGDQSQHFTDCFQLFLGGAFQCPGVSYTPGTAKDSNDQDCESVVPNLAFSPTDWKAFADFNVDPPSVARAVLTSKGLSSDDLRSVAIAFEGVKTGLIGGDLPADKYTQCRPSCPLGGQACIPDVPDAGGIIPDAGSDATDAGPG
jgi:hypothetical protein